MQNNVAGLWHRRKTSRHQPSTVVVGATPQNLQLQTRAPSELKCLQSNGALYFLNPLFAKLHQSDAEDLNVTLTLLVTPSSADHRCASSTLPSLWTHTGSDTRLDKVKRSSSSSSEFSHSETSDVSRPPSFRPSSSPPSEEDSSAASSSDHEDPSVPPQVSGRNPGSSSTASRTSSEMDKDGFEDSFEESLYGSSLNDSSGSLSPFMSTAFFLPDLHDPCPPTMEDLDTHLPLSLPFSPLSYCPLQEEEDIDNCLSYSLDLERDCEATKMPLKPSRRQPSSILPRALQKHLHTVSGVFNSILTPEKRLVQQVLELSRDKDSYFGSLVRDFLDFMHEGAAVQCYASGEELLQVVRQFITQMKIYLQHSSESESVSSLIPEERLDDVLERALHKCLLKPLKPVLSKALLEIQVRRGTWQQLRDNLSFAKTQGPEKMDLEGLTPPDDATLDKIRHKFHTLCKLYSPEAKVRVLLRVCKLIYTVVEESSGRLCGADDFLPMLTYVLAQIDMPDLDNEILYMMELLDPTLLHGEGGYYLTSAFGAMSLLRTFKKEKVVKVLSKETRHTLKQWHCRRTTQQPTPAIEDFQCYLRVVLHELPSGCTAKTLVVGPSTTTQEVLHLCALKFQVSDPGRYGLFLRTEDRSWRLAADACPQQIKAQFYSFARPAHFCFVFRREVGGDVRPATIASFEDTSLSSDPRGHEGNLPRTPSCSRAAAAWVSQVCSESTSDVDPQDAEDQACEKKRHLS